MTCLFYDTRQTLDCVLMETVVYCMTRIICLRTEAATVAALSLHLSTNSAFISMWGLHITHSPCNSPVSCLASYLHNWRVDAASRPRAGTDIVTRMVRRSRALSVSCCSEICVRAMMWRETSRPLQRPPAVSLLTVSIRNDSHVRVMIQINTTVSFM